MDQKLLSKIEKLDQAGTKKPIKTWARSSSINPQMVGHRMQIHDGKNFKEVLINEAMVGHKLGEFAPTRKFMGHSKKGVKKEEDSKQK